MRKLRDDYEVDRSRVARKDVDSEVTTLAKGMWAYPFNVYNWRALRRAKLILRQQGLTMIMWTELGGNRIVCEILRSRR